MSEASNVSRPLRADAARNREKILAAAATLFAERGLEATLDDVAEAADVGVATLYRRFPDKNLLVTALFEDAIEEFATLAERANQRPDSWEGFVWFLEQVLERQCASRGLRDVFVGSPYAQAVMDSARDRIVPIVMVLVERAQRDGHLRADLVEADLSVLEMMVSSLGGRATTTSPDLWRRYLAIMLDGLVVRRLAPSPLPPAPSDEQVLRALRAASSAR
jgi:AcrR family transcriptional regulator